MQDKEVTVVSKAGDEGKLFGSIGCVTLPMRLTAAGVAVEKSEVFAGRLIRNTGEYEVDVHLAADVNATVVKADRGR